MPSLPQTHALFAANVIIRSCKRYHPLLQTLSSALQTFASDSGFFFRVTLSQVWSSSRSVDFVLDTAVCVGAAERCL